MYRIRLRDSLYLGMIHRMAVMNTWDEQMAEDEHVLVKKIRKQVDWTQSFIEPEIGVMVDDPCASISDPARLNLAKYEEAFSRIPLSYCLYTTQQPPPGTIITIDGSKPYSQPKFQSDGGNLPDEMKSSMPLVISQNYCASFAL